MKRIFLLVVTALMVSQTINAQIGSFKIDKNGLVKAIERSDKDLENEKRAARGQTWLDNGNALYAAAGIYLTKIYPGQSKAELFTLVGKAEPTEETINGNIYQALSYPFGDIYMKSDKVQFWVEKIDVYEGASERAVISYKKAAELDKKLTAKAKDGLERVSDVYKMRANTAHSLGKNEEAAANYYKAFLIQKDPLVNIIDSASIFNAGYIYLTLNEYDKAIEVFKEATSSNVWESGKTAYYLFFSYMRTERFDEAKQILVDGMKMFPDSKELTESLVSYYSITRDDFIEIKDIIEKALVTNPTSIVLWDGLGQAYLSENDVDKCIEYFTKYAEAFPKEFQSNYYLGDMWIEKGNRLLDEANETAAGMSKAEHEAMIAKAMDAYRNSWDPLVKAYEINPKQRVVVQRLARISYRLIDDPGMEAEHKKYNAEYEAMPND